jgi:hypothetical protein
MMDEEVRQEEEEKEARQKKEELEKKDREKTEKNRAKREKARLRKEKAKKGAKESTPAAEETAKKKLVPNVNGVKVSDEKHDEENNNEGGEVKNADEIGLVIEDDD